MPSPIVLFVYNRPWHTQQTVEALQKNLLANESDLIIFSDGPKSLQGIEKIKEVRAFLKTIRGFKSITIIESEFNKGLANSIINGVTQVLKDYETVIVLEDDMITSPQFLSYMNQGLTLYREDNQVACIHGYFFPVENQCLPETFFIKGADCWGWATWRRGWEIFESNPFKLLLQILLKRRKREFDYDNSYAYTRMLLSQCLGRIDSWAIRWYASTFLKNKLTLYPAVSLVKNIGLDNSGTHTREWNKKAFDIELTDIHAFQLKKIKVEESKDGRSARAGYFSKTNIPLLKKIIYNLTFGLKKITSKSNNF
jgi:hypothetical protein